MKLSPNTALELIATDAEGNVSEIKSLTLDINNLDEVAPTIISSITDVFVDENISTDQVIFSINTDDSGDISSGVTYSLSGTDAAAFSISNDEASFGEVTFSKSPNFEAQRSYEFSVIAEDAAGNSTEESFTVGINNLDEVAPRLTSSDTASVEENSVANQVIYRASADDNADISGGVTYSLVEGSDSSLSIDASTGEVTLADNPNFETKPEYSFEIIATDAAGNVSEPKAVTLNIGNIDEVAPTINSSISAAVLETAGANAVVYQATADDSGDISNGVTFSLSGDDAAEFEIDAESGAVTLIADPNDDPNRSYSFDIAATDDAGNASEAVSVSLAIIKEDPDAPVITSAASVAVDENIGSGQVVYTVTAEDLTVLTFELVGGDDADKFTIDSASGEVTLIEDPDYEVKDEYKFEVRAEDRSQNYSEVKLVTLNINNLDEVAPSLALENTVTNIDENTGAAQVILNAIADDSADTSDGVTFSLGGVDAGKFDVDQQGQVTLIADPDNELQSSYDLTVIATDNAGNSSEESYSLVVNDLDDASPTVTFENAITSIDENTGADQVIVTAIADDSGDNIQGGVTFRLAEGSDSALSIDTQTGVVTLTENPNFEAKEEYSFAVIATDAAGNASDAKAMTLNIQNLDEVAPTITSGITSIAIDENSGAGQVIFTPTDR